MHDQFFYSVGIIKGCMHRLAWYLYNWIPNNDSDDDIEFNIKYFNNFFIGWKSSLAWK